MSARGFIQTDQSADLLSFDDYATQTDVSALIYTLQQRTFVHAYLFSGMEGLGKRSLALLMAQYLLCTCDAQSQGFLGEFSVASVKRPCGLCPGCVQVRSGNHPDLVRIGNGRHISADNKDAGKSSITVGDIREAVRIAGTHSFEGGNRVFLIEQAQDMTLQAQNSLLKTLQEPIEGNIFILTTDSPSLLLTTIISRCRQVKLHAYPDNIINKKLDMIQLTSSQKAVILRSCGGSIGKALKMARDEHYWMLRQDVLTDFFAMKGHSEIVHVSGKYKDAKDQADYLLDEIEALIHTMLMVRLGRHNPQICADFPECWQHMANSAELSHFTTLLDAVSKTRQFRLSQVNWQAALEQLLFKIMEEQAKW